MAISEAEWTKWLGAEFTTTGYHARKDRVEALVAFLADRDDITPADIEASLASA